MVIAYQDEDSIIANSILALDTPFLEIRLDERNVGTTVLNGIKRVIRKYPGNCPSSYRLVKEIAENWC